MLAPRPTRLPSNRRDRTPVLVPARRAATRMRPPYFCVVLPSLLAFRPSLGVKSSSGMATLLSLAIRKREWRRSEEHTSELQSLMRISYAVFCLKKKKKNHLYIDGTKYTTQTRAT